MPNYTSEEERIRASRSSIEADMIAFDSLPPEIREHLRYSWANFPATEVKSVIVREGGWIFLPMFLDGNLQYHKELVARGLIPENPSASPLKPLVRRNVTRRV